MDELALARERIKMLEAALGWVGPGALATPSPGAPPAEEPRRTKYDPDDPRRWEWAFRNIAGFFVGSRAEFEIGDIVERVRVLVVPPAEKRCLLCGGSIDGHGHPPREWDAALNSGLPNRAPPAAPVPEEPEEPEEEIREAIEYLVQMVVRDRQNADHFRYTTYSDKARAALEAAIVAALRRARSGK